MKSILSKIEFHYTFFIIALGFVLTGHFVNLIVFTSIIIIHELGHFITAILFKYKVSKIIIYPYGGITKLDTFINTNINKDLIISISGIIFQCIYFFIVYLIYNMGYIREYIYQLFYTYHYSMLFFNLLPIIPLDGSKILSCLIYKYFNFNLSNNILVFISLTSIIFLLYGGIYKSNYGLIMTIGVLMKNIYNFYKNIDFVYNRFLLERYLYRFNYKKKSIIKSKNKMYKNRYHYVYKNGNIVEEKEYLNDFFKKKK